MRTDSRPERRAWLLLRGTHQTTASVAGSGADAVVIDLRAWADRARELSQACLEAGTEVFWLLRRERDIAALDAIDQDGWSGVVLAVDEPLALVEELEDKLAELEHRRQLSPGVLEVVACLEHARANLSAAPLMQRERVSTVTLGRADAVMDLRPEPSGEIHLMGYLSRRLILLATAFGKVAIGASWTAEDHGLASSPEGSYRAARLGRMLGFRGTMCVRQDQVKPIQAAFAPSTEELERASAMLGTSHCDLTHGSWVDPETLALHARTMLAEPA